MGGMRHRCGLSPEDLGPYLLDGLSVSERRRVEQLLVSCPDCTAELDELRPVLTILAAAAASVELEPAPEPAGSSGSPTEPLPSDALDRMLAAVHAERPGGRTTSPGRSWRRPVIVAAATVVVAALVTGGLTLLGGDHGTRVTLRGAAGAHAGARLSDRSWGTALRLDAHGLKPGTAYGAWLAYPDGRRLAAGTFVAQPDGSAVVDLAAALPLGQAATLGVTTLGGDDVLTVRLH
jgi:anti-sigma factor RsiW